ncbi:MAG: DUF2079 domain-containing protein [Polyangiaceae bacterium]
MSRATAPSAFQLGGRAVVLFCITAFAIALGTGLMREPLFSVEYFWSNNAIEAERLSLLAYVLTLPALAGVLGTVAFVRSLPSGVAGAERLYRIAVLTSPLGPLAGIPWLLRWNVWVGHDLAYLVASLLITLALGRSVSAAIRSLPTGGDSPLFALTRDWLAPRPGAKNVLLRDPGLVAIIAASALYICYFGYYTSVFHLSVRSGFDTGIEDNILWNMSHGGPFFKATPALGPTGAHFRRHATLIAYFLAPFYWLKPGAATVMWLQAFLQGSAAVPLFLFARRHLSHGFALLVAIAYLFHPALQESNLFEVHYVKFGPVFLWTALWLFDSGRMRAALIAAALTLLVREDVATWVILLGAWGLLSGRDPRTSLIIMGASCVYVVLIKFIAMPALAHGKDELMFMYAELLPKDKNGFAWVMGTVLGNPAFTLETLLDPAKLVFILQAYVPLAFIPLRRAIGWFALIPWCLFCFISTHYYALVDIHFQYSPHLFAFGLPALVLILAEPVQGLGQAPSAGNADPSALLYLRETTARRYGMVATMLAGTLLLSYQFGAVLQQNTSRGGPIPYVFGWTDEGRARHASVEALKEVIPWDGKVTGSAFIVPQFSARPNAYSLSISVFDADYIVAPSGRKEHLPDELNRIRDELSSGRFGVLKVEGPFFVAKRGHDTSGNDELLRHIGAR